MIIFKLQWKKKRIKESPKNYTKGVLLPKIIILHLVKYLNNVRIGLSIERKAYNSTLH